MVRTSPSVSSLTSPSRTHTSTSHSRSHARNKFPLIATSSNIHRNTNTTGALPLPIIPIPSTKSTHSRKRSIGHIKRPRNAFILFRSAFIAQRAIPAEVEGDHRNLSRIIGQVWRKMSASEKEPWVRMSREERTRHRECYPDFKYRNGSAAKSGSSGARKKKKSEEEDGEEEQPDEDGDKEEERGDAKDVRVGRGNGRRAMTRRRRSSSCPPPDSIAISNISTIPTTFLGNTSAPPPSTSQDASTITTTAAAAPPSPPPPGIAVSTIQWSAATCSTSPQIAAPVHAHVGVTHDDIIRRPSLTTVYHTNPTHSTTPLLDLGTHQQILSSQGYYHLPTSMEEWGLAVASDGWVWACSKARMQEPDKTDPWIPVLPSQAWMEGNGTAWDAWQGQPEECYFLPESGAESSMELQQLDMQFTNPFSSDSSFM